MLLINLSNIDNFFPLKFFWECWESNSGQQGPEASIVPCSPSQFSLLYVACFCARCRRPDPIKNFQPKFNLRLNSNILIGCKKVTWPFSSNQNAPIHTCSKLNINIIICSGPVLVGKWFIYAIIWLYLLQDCLSRIAILRSFSFILSHKAVLKTTRPLRILFSLRSEIDQSNENVRFIMNKTHRSWN